MNDDGEGSSTGIYFKEMDESKCFSVMNFHTRRFFTLMNINSLKRDMVLPADIFLKDTSSIISFSL